MKKRITVGGLGWWTVGSYLAPGTRIQLSGSACSANDGEVLYLRQVDASTAEVLTLPLAWGHGLLLAFFWVVFQVGRAWRALKRRFR